MQGPFGAKTLQTEKHFFIFIEQTEKRCYDIGGSDIGGSDIGGPDIGGFLATLEALSKKDIGGLVTLEAC